MSSLHETLTTKFRDLILSNQWEPGYRLLFETELAEKHGVSRMTMNKVLSQLTREGYLIRRRKLGTFVAQPRTQSPVMEIASVKTQVEALGLNYDYHLIDREIRAATSNEKLRGEIPMDHTANVLALQMLHSAGDSPFCLERRIINIDTVPGVLDVDFSEQTPSEWLRQEIPWKAAKHTIRAVNADTVLARGLGLALGEACLEVIRRTESAGQWVTIVSQTYPSDRHQLVTHFTPTGERNHDSM